MFDWLPENASNLASGVDNVILFVTVVSVFFFFLISAFLVFFAIKYRRRSDQDETPYITGNEMLEVVWTVIPSVILMVIFAWGYIQFAEMRNPPSDAMEVNVTARQWLWQFDYYNGKRTINELYVQQNRPVKMVMRSEDVLHSFFVPDFRVKQDILPGNYTQLWFTPTKIGTFDLYCAEYCGTNHSKMLAKVNVLSPEAFAIWEKGIGIEEAGGALAVNLSPAESGRKLYDNRGCGACHSIDGSDGIGPTFKALFGKVEKLQSGETITVEENYIRESILNPNEKMVEGYAPVMPSFIGILSDEEITDIIEYIKTLK